MKKSLSVIMPLLLTFCVLAGAVSANAAERDSNSVAVQAGDKVRYCVYVQAADYTLSGVNLTVDYDIDCLEIAYDGQTKLAEMSDLPSGILNADESGTGTIVATYADGIKGTDLSQGLKILDVEFNATKEATAKIDYYMEELFDFSGDEVVYIDKSNVFANVYVNGEPFGTDPLIAEADNIANSESKDNAGSDTASLIVICAVAAVAVAGVAVIIVFFVRFNSERKKSKSKTKKQN